jgi:hypothetical protein
MTIVRTFTLPHYEAFPIHVALFRDVKNASHLRSQLLEANAEYDYAFLDAEMVRPIFCSSAHLCLLFRISISEFGPMQKCAGMWSAISTCLDRVSTSHAAN